MSSVSKAALFLAVCCCASSFAAAAGTLRVCADPNDLPYSNRKGQGFENQLAQLVAKDFGETVAYVWYPQRSKFFKKTLNAGICDVVMGVPAGMPVASTTQPYYRSSYVFVTRRDRNLKIDSFDDPRLRDLRIGIHIPGAGDSSAPPAYALSSRGIVRNVVEYSELGTLTEKDPSADLIRAVAQKKVDVAIVWGPVAGYFAQKSRVPLRLVPVKLPSDGPDTPFAFDISMGVRRGDKKLQRQLDEEIVRREPQIRRLLTSYGIPQLNMSPPAAATGY